MHRDSSPVHETICLDAYDLANARVSLAFDIVAAHETPGRAVFLRIANRVEARVILHITAQVREPILLRILPE